MQKKYLDVFFESGSIRVGTLYDFRKHEAHNKAIADQDEGTLKPYMKFGSSSPSIINNKSPEMPFLKDIFKMDEESSIQLQDIGIHKTEQSSDYYIFCASTVFDKKAMEEFECDACIKINDARKFFNALTVGLAHIVSKMDWQGTISYRSREDSYLALQGIHPATVKGIEYAYQKEYRGIWSSKYYSFGNLTPVIIAMPELMKYCEPY